MKPIAIAVAAAVLLTGVDATAADPGTVPEITVYSRPQSSAPKLKSWGVEGEMLSTTPGNTPYASEIAQDLNGDGKISKDEVTPGSSLARRFDERDTNHDGFLTQEEYFMPPGSGANPDRHVVREAPHLPMPSYVDPRERGQ